MIHQCNRVKPACQITPKIWHDIPIFLFIHKAGPHARPSFLGSLAKIIALHLQCGSLSLGLLFLCISTSLCDSRYSALENRRMDDMFSSTTFFSPCHLQIFLCVSIFLLTIFCHFAYSKETQGVSAPHTHTHSHQNQTQSKCKSNQGTDSQVKHLLSDHISILNMFSIFSAPPPGSVRLLELQSEDYRYKVLYL